MFFINLLKVSEEAVVQAIGLQTLKAPIRVPLDHDVFISLFKKKSDTEELNTDLQEVIKRVIAEKHCKVTTIPIQLKENGNKLHTKRIHHFKTIYYRLRVSGRYNHYSPFNVLRKSKKGRLFSSQTG